MNYEASIFPISISDGQEEHIFPLNHLRTAIEYVTGAHVFLVDMEKRHILCSETFQKEYFQQFTAGYYTLDNLYSIIYERDRDKASHLFSTLLRGKAHKRSIDIRLNTHHDEKLSWVSLRCKAVKSHRQETFLVCALIPSTQMPHIDELTQIKNAAAFSRVVKDYIHEKKSFALMLLNISNFSMINYQHSRHYGDTVLINFASYLSNLLSQDEANQCFRTSGNTFALILRDSSPQNINIIYSSIKKHLHLMYNINAAFCSCNYPENASTLEELIQLSDYLLIQARRREINGIVSYDETTENSFSNYRLLQSNLRHSIDNNFRGFYLVYQPYINVQKNKLIGAEALARYTDEQGNAISPEKFIPIIENMKMMCEFGRWIVREAIKALQQFSAIFPDMVVNINISHEQLNDKHLFDYIMDTANEFGVDPSQIELEFTEHFLSKEYTYINSAIEKIHKKGVLIAMDDFGTGYSSLGFLKDINVDIVKIDKIFVKNFMNDEVKKFFLECIISLCKKLKRKTILEGIEHHDEYMAIRSLGIDMVQGYYYSRPRPFESIIDFIKNQHQND